MTPPTRRAADWIRRWAAGLRFPQLLALTLVLLAVDLALPDPVPLLDEVVLALLALLFGSVRRGRRGERGDERRGAGRDRAREGARDGGRTDGGS